MLNADPGPAPCHLDGVGCAGQQRLLHRHPRPAPGQEDGEFRRAGRLSPLLWRRARHAGLGDDLLSRSPTSARAARAPARSGRPSSRCRRGRCPSGASGWRPRGVAGLAEDSAVRRGAAELRRAGRRRAGAGRGRGRPRALDRRRRAGRRGDPRLSFGGRCGCATRARPTSSCASWATRPAERAGELTRYRAPEPATAPISSTSRRCPAAAAPTSARDRCTISPSRCPTGRRSSRCAQALIDTGAPGDAGDRPRLFLGDLLPHPRRRALRGGDRPSPASIATRSPRISARR